MAKLPNAHLVAHPRGARHMVDPSMLWAGASAVYGEETMQREYGRLRPVPAERVIESADGYVVDLQGRPLLCLETPGHAKHHQAIYDERARVCFTGDTFGLSYRELDTVAGPFILPTTTPVQFDPAALHASIHRLLALKPEAMYLTHYGRVEMVSKLAEDLHEQIDAMVAIAQSLKDAPGRHEAMKDALARLYLERAHLHGWQGSHDELLILLGMDVELNAQGLGVWLDQHKA
jgi:glyoxylase-like metal-dependent hydrolase (beta-lactamase superfamily II)